MVQARRRLQQHGPNVLAAETGPGPWRLLARQYSSPLVLILVIAAGISAGIGEWTESAIILAIVAASTLLGFRQEYMAARALQALRRRLVLRVTTIRGGAPRQIEASALVPGDVILLSAGNLIPADGLILEARDFLVSQAALTGESFPVEKHAGLVAPDAGLAERSNAAFLGSSVRSGTARMVIVATGRDTALGAIAGRLGTAEPETDFERGIRQYGYLLARVMMVIVTLVLTTNLLLHRPLIESLLFSVALAVGLTPELLPAILSVTMSAGARHMAGKGVIVRRPSAIEGLGSVDILCTDKTGTLTRGVVALDAATDPAGQPSDRVFGLALINAHLETGIVNPLDEAIVASAATRGQPLPSPPKIDEIPYDFLRKRLTIVIDLVDEPDHLIITKGAFDTVLACCNQIAVGAGAEPLDDAGRARLTAFYARKGGEGFRVLGVASRRLPPRPRYLPADETRMVFEGFLLFFDPLKEGIVENLHRLQALGVAVTLITGDNRHVAAHVAQAVGLKGPLITGADLARTRDEALWHLAETTAIFAEVDPQQKERIVRALQVRGHRVAYLGDGINDAPALRRADVGISVDQAVDVARDSADVVLVERDLGVLAQGITDGRLTFANTLKYISITTSANFGNMVSMAIGTLFLPFLPLLAAQILLNNFLSDLPSLAISTDKVDPEAVQKAPRWNVRQVRTDMIVFGLVSTGFDLLTFVMLTQLFHTPEALFQSAWFLISLLTELAVVLVLRSRRWFWQSAPSRVLSLTTALVATLAVGLPYLGLPEDWIGFVPLPGAVLAGSLAIVLAYVVTTELAKHLRYRLFPDRR